MAREAWRQKQPELSAGKLIFLDETWTTTNMVRRYGRAICGQRLVDAVPHGHWQISTFIGGLRQSGMVAPCVIDGAVDGKIFLAYIEQFLVPELRPGDTVIMDNLSSHKVAGVRPAIKAAGANLLYLPPLTVPLILVHGVSKKRIGAPGMFC